MGGEAGLGDGGGGALPLAWPPPRGSPSVPLTEALVWEAGWAVGAVSMVWALIRTLTLAVPLRRRQGPKTRETPGQTRQD